MGINCGLYQASEQEITSLQGNPGQIFDFINDPMRARQSLDKAFHGIHFLLAEDPWGGDEPLCYLMQGGVELLPSVRALSTGQVARFDTALQLISLERFRERYDPSKMDDSAIYPQIWVRDLEDGLRYLESYFVKLKSFVATTALQQTGLLITKG